MRFRLHLELKGTSPYVVPINYQYELSSWIYKTIHHGNNEFATWLHEKGYMDKTRQYKVFCFSQLGVDKFTVDKDRLIISNNQASLLISFFANEAAEPFIKGLFMQHQGSIGDKISRVDFAINQIARIEDPDFSESMVFNTISPMIVSQTPDVRGTDQTRSLIYEL